MLNGILKHYPKKRLHPVGRKSGRAGERAAWIVICVFFSHSRVDFVSCLLLLRLFSWFICWTARYSSLVPKVYPSMAICRTYLFNFFRLSCALALLTRSFIRWLALNLFCAHSISVVIEFIFHPLFRRHNIRSVVLFIHARLWAHTHSPFETSQRREEKKTYDEQIFCKNNSKYDLSVVVLGAFL